MLITGSGLHWGIRAEKIRPQDRTQPFMVVKASSFEKLPAEVLKELAANPPFIESDKSAADLIREKMPPTPVPESPGIEGGGSPEPEKGAP